MTTLRMGFTIVELLIVIVVIGILAAITTMGYNGVIGSAQDAAIKSDVSQAMKRLEIYMTQNASYPFADPAELATLDIKATKDSYHTGFGNFIYCYTYAGGTEHVAMGAATKRGKMWYATTREGGGVKEFTDPIDVNLHVVEVCSHLLGVPSGSLEATRGYAPDEGGWQSWVK